MWFNNFKDVLHKFYSPRIITMCCGTAESVQVQQRVWEKPLNANLARTLLCRFVLVPSRCSYLYWYTHSEYNGGNLAGERMRRDMNVSVSICWITSVGTSEISTHSLWTATRTVNSEWPACACHSSKAVTVGHISLWPGRDVTHSNIPATRYHAHAKHRALSVAHPTAPAQIVSTSTYTHQHLCRCSTLRWPLPERGQNVPFTRSAGQSK